METLEKSPGNNYKYKMVNSGDKEKQMESSGKTSISQVKWEAEQEPIRECKEKQIPENV